MLDRHPKLYLLTRADLSPGQQATQSAHAAFQFAVEHPEITRPWYEESTYLVLLGVPTEDDLLAVLGKLHGAAVPHSVWCEPDMDHQCTAVAVAPSAEASRLLANLPLTLREPAMSG